MSHYYRCFKLDLSNLSSALFLALIIHLAPATADSKVDTATPANPPQVSAIPVGSLTTRAEQLRDHLASIESELNDKDSLELRESELAKMIGQISAAGIHLNTVLAGYPSGDTLGRLSSEWESYQDNLVEHGQSLESLLVEYKSWLDMIREQSAIWKLSYSEARKESAPDKIISGINQVRKNLRSLDGKLIQSRNQILNIQVQYSDYLNQAQNALKRIKSAQNEFGKGMLVRQDAPLWRSWPTWVSIDQELTGAKLHLIRAISEFVQFVQKNFETLIGQALFILALGWFLRARYAILRGHEIGLENKLVPTAIKSQSIEALDHPWSAAIISGLLLNTYLYEQKALGLTILSGLVGLVLWIRLIRPMVPHALHPILLTVALLAFLDTLRIGLGGFGFVTRCLLLLILAMGWVAVQWLRHSQWRTDIAEALGNGLWANLFNGWLFITWLTFGAGVIAVLLGYSYLADQITFLAVWGSIIATAILAIVRIIEAVFQSMVEEGKFDRLRMIKTNHDKFMNVIRKTLRAVGFVVWITVILDGLQIRIPVLEWIKPVLLAQLGHDPVTFSLAGFISFAITLWISWLIARFLTFVLDQEVFSRLHFAPGIPFAITTFTRYTILVIGFLVALTILGIPLDKITLLLSALGVGIGFGLQTITNNFVSGIILLFERPIRVGDKVQLADLIGTVASIGIRASTIRGFDGADVIVPNGDFISARVTNWTLADQKRRIILPVKTAYGTKPRAVIKLLESIAHNHPEILDEPQAQALFCGFGEGYLDFELRAWTESTRGWMTVMSDLAVLTNDALSEANIEIPLPKRDISLRNIDELTNALNQTGDKKG